MIIAVDFDGTLYKDKQPNLLLINKLKANQQQGDCIILWTCREGKRLKEAILLLRNCGFSPNLVNENHISIIKRFGYNPRKVFADIYIDDKEMS